MTTIKTATSEQSYTYIGLGELIQIVSMHSALMAETAQAYKLAEYLISAEGYPVQHSGLQCVQGLL